MAFMDREPARLRCATVSAVSREPWPRDAACGGRDHDVRDGRSEQRHRFGIRGSLAQRGANLAITAELVNVRDATQLWGEKYARRSDDV